MGNIKLLEKIKNYDKPWCYQYQKRLDTLEEDLGKYGDYTSFSRQELTIPNPQYWSEDNPVLYTLILRLKIVNKPLSTASGRFRLLNDNN